MYRQRLGLRGDEVLAGEDAGVSGNGQLGAFMASMAGWDAASFALEGLLMPLILRTNCREAARTSLSVTGGSKLKRSFMLRHMGCDLQSLSPLERISIWLSAKLYDSSNTEKGDLH